MTPSPVLCLTRDRSSISDSHLSHVKQKSKPLLNVNFSRGLFHTDCSMCLGLCGYTLRQEHFPGRRRAALSRHSAGPSS